MMDSYQETFETWDKVAALYQDKFMNLDLYNTTYDAFCEWLPASNSKILDIGCGPGNITKYLLHQRPDLDIYGVDIAPNMIALAKSNNPTAAFEVMDSRHIDTLTGSFHGIVCGFCLPYLSHVDVSKLIHDCADLLYSDGVLYLSFVDGDRAKSGYVTGSSGDRTYFYYHAANDIVSYLSQHGCYNIKKFDIGYQRSSTEAEIHTILIARKWSNA